VQVASALPEEALALAPLPPQRPKDLLPVFPSAKPSTAEPPEEAVLVAAQASPPEPILGFDETAAVRALFDPRTTVAAVGFSQEFSSNLSAAEFSGPAVKPLPLTRQAQLDL
jgi:hypothetical protein